MPEPVFVDHRLIDCTSLAPGALEQWVWEDAAAQSLLDCTTGQLRPKHTLLQQNLPQAAGGSGQHEGLEALVVRLVVQQPANPSIIAQPPEDKNDRKYRYPPFLWEKVE